MDNSDSHLIVIATSCIEAGIDVSFRWGFRENAGVLNVQQFAGRVRRNAERKFRVGNGDVFVFELEVPERQNRQEGDFTLNWDLANSIAVYDQLLQQHGLIGPEHSDEAFSAELAMGLGGRAELLIQHNKDYQFQQISDLSRVIARNQLTCIPSESVDAMLADMAAKNRDWIPSSEISRRSFQIFEYKANGYADLIQEGPLAGIYRWTGPYDDQFGYMA